MTTVLQFSGGKDSLACMYLYRDQWPTLHVAWVNTGAAYAEVIRAMDVWKMKIPNFHEIRSDQRANLAQFGWPADVVPLHNTVAAAQFIDRDGPLVQSYLDCCGANIWRPMTQFCEQLGAKVIIRGTRRSDKRRNRYGHGDVVDGVLYLCPIYEWSDDDVMNYLGSVDAPIPAAYMAGEKTGRDCWDCTAYLDDNAVRIANLAERERAEVLGRLAAIDGAVRRQWDAGYSAVKEGG